MTNLGLLPDGILLTKSVAVITVGAVSVPSKENNFSISTHKTVFETVFPT